MNFLYQGLISTIKFVNDYLKKNKEIDLEYFITLPLAYDIIRNLTPCKELWGERCMVDNLLISPFALIK